MEPTPVSAFSGLASAATPVSKGTRFGEYLIDAIVYGIISGIIGFVLGMVGMAELAQNRFVSYLIGAVVGFIYYYMQEKGSGLTIGKRLLGTKAVMADGSPLTDEAALKRSLWRLVPFEAFSFLFSDTGWHDKFSGTTVVSNKGVPTVAPTAPSQY